jgi:hypothetical protein
MADDLDVRLRLQNARRFSSDTKRAAKDVDRIGDAADRTKRDAREAGTALRGIGAAGRRGFSGIGRILGAAGGIYALSRGIRSVAEEYTEAARSGAQTDAVIRSTRGVAGLTRTEVEGLAAALSRKAAIDDELIQSGANVLLTFKEIRNEAGRGNKIFDRATAAALDLSVAFGKDMRSSSVLVGKALNDPVKGLTALTRVGVAFTDQQTEQVKALVESGDKLGAQRIIIRELESQVKGSAKAQAQPMDKLRVGWANLQESIGRLAAPAVNKGIQKAADLVGDLEESLAPIWERGDLAFEEKMERSLPRIEKAFEKAEVGEGLGKAVEAGVPIIADAMAAASPRAAKAFVTGFKNAGPWGQLLTVAFLTQKMGGFRAAGSWGARAFMDRFGPRLTLKSIFRTAATEGAAAGSTAAASTMAGEGAGSLAMANTRKARGFRRAGRIAGRFIGFGIAAGAIAAFLDSDFRDQIEEELSGWANDVFGLFGGDPLAPSSGPSMTEGQRLMDENPGFRFHGKPKVPRNRNPIGRKPKARAQSLPVRSVGSSLDGGEWVGIPWQINLDKEVLAKGTAKAVRRRKASQ